LEEKFSDNMKQLMAFFDETRSQMMSFNEKLKIKIKILPFTLNEPLYKPKQSKNFFTRAAAFGGGNSIPNFLN